MTPLFKKLNYKNQERIVVWNSPHSFDIELLKMSDSAAVDRTEAASKIAFAIVFVTTKMEIEKYIKQINSQLLEDAVLWFCYPKASSKKYNCDFNRDSGWESLGKHEFEGVRQVAIDEDWSAIRFRKTAYIKVVSRRESFALSKSGKSRVGK
jgi:hypothetical protein